MTALKKLRLGVTSIALIVIVLILGAASFSLVPEGHVGVKLQFGRIVANDLSAGAHFHLPFVEAIRTVDVREQIYETSTDGYTKDTQTVENVQVKLNYVYDQSQLTHLIRTVGIENVESKLIIPQVNSVLKNSIGGFRAEDLVQNRAALQEKVETELRNSLVTSGIIVTAFNIESLDFEEAFEQAIRLKVEAEQEALRMQNETVSKQEQARQTVIAAQAAADSQRLKAEAEAYAIELIQKQLQASPEYIQLQMVEKWNGEWPQVMGNTVNPFVTIGGSTASAAP